MRKGLQNRLLREIVENNDVIFIVMETNLCHVNARMLKNLVVLHRFFETLRIGSNAIGAAAPRGNVGRMVFVFCYYGS